MSTKQTNDGIDRRGPLAWIARNTVAANLLMMVLVVGGLLLSGTIPQEVFPEVDLDVITITVPYPGASTTEVEEGVVLAIEEAVRGLDGVKEVRSIAQEDVGTVIAELFTGTQRNRALNDVKNAIDRITSFPQDAEEPIVSLPTSRVQVLSLIVHGPLERLRLHQIAERIRSELVSDERITLVERSGLPPPEISIEIEQERLRSLGLTLGEVARRIGAASIDLPGGTLETPSGEVLLRVAEERESADSYRQIVIASDPQGSELTLGDIARVQEGFRETSDQQAWYAGNSAVRLLVYQVGEETPISVSSAVHEYIARARGQLPGQVGLAVIDDMAEIYEDRMSLLVRNGQFGIALVLLILGIFLHPRLAFWVTLGIPVSFLGALLFIPGFGVSINMISLFAFLLVLGIVVDDAIVVGEATFRQRRAGLAPLDASIAGTREVLQPVIFAVLTTSMAFVPMLFVPGVAGEFFWPIPVIVITILMISLLESLAILPAHLAHVPEGVERRDTPLLGWFTRRQRRFSEWFEAQVEERYRPAAERLIEYRYLTLAAAFALLLIAVGLVAGGRLQFTFIPRIEADLVTVGIELPFGAPVATTRSIVEQVSEAARRTARELASEENGELLRGVYAEIGTTAVTGPGDVQAIGGGSGGHLAMVQAFLQPGGERTVSAERFSDAWRRNVGEIAGVERLAYSWDAGPPAGDAIAIELSHADQQILRSAAANLAAELADYGGVRDVNDGFAYGKPQIDFTLKPAARALGLTAADLGAQLRDAFFGAEAVRQQRGRFELRVYVRRPDAEQDSEYHLENLIVRTPQGGEIPLTEAATLHRERSATQIERTNGERTVAVTADVNPAIASAGRIVEEIERTVLPELERRYPGLNHQRAGEREAEAEALTALGRGMALTLLAMYALLAIAFGSYTQPMIVMLAIPFGFIGAALGHLLLGFDLSLISLLGLVALAGVVVNDSLVLVAAINDYRRRGQPVHQAVVDGCVRRLRPVLLTSLTTFFGLAPIIFETSLQARFLIPMALSLGFGVLFVTLIVLAITPAIYMVGGDVQRGIAGMKARIGASGLLPRRSS